MDDLTEAVLHLRDCSDYADDPLALEALHALETEIQRLSHALKEATDNLQRELNRSRELFNNRRDTDLVFDIFYATYDELVAKGYCQEISNE